MKKALFIIIILLESNLIFSQKSVTIFGKDIDPAIKEIKYQKINYFIFSAFNKDKIVSTKVNNGKMILKFNIDSPKLLIIDPPGYSKPVTIMMTPGDSIGFTLKKIKSDNYEFEFIGKNSAHYNYKTYLNHILINYKPPVFNLGGNLNLYKEQIEGHRKLLMDIFNTYKSNYPVSEDYEKYIMADIENEFNCRLYFPIRDNKVKIDTISMSYFKDSCIVKNSLSLWYLTALLTKNIYLYSDSSFTSAKEHIFNSYTGKDLSYLYSALIGFFSERQDIRDFDEITMAVKESKKIVKEPDYLDYINRSYKYYTTAHHPLPENILNETYFKEYKTNQKISLKTLLNKYNDKIIYIDIWASWCSPCRFDISNSAEAKEILKNSGVVWLYLSHDNDEKLWRKAVEEENIKANQYLLLDIKNSPLLKYLIVNSIPRYVLLDNKHYVELLNAPRPNSELQTNPELIKCINCIHNKSKISSNYP